MTDNTPVDPVLLEQLKKLQAKYNAMGQDLSSYLDGLLYADYLTYWDYIHLDTLLSLQNPKTQFPDEKIFILYHQITELYFKLILHELEQITATPQPAEAFFIDRLDRIIRYFRHLENSFDVMVQGMEKEQFLKFRMALLPASANGEAIVRVLGSDGKLVERKIRTGLDDKTFVQILAGLQENEEVVVSESNAGAIGASVFGGAGATSR